MDDGDDNGRALVVEIGIWECNVKAFAVFRLCTIAAIGTFGGLFWTGIEAVEIRAACLLCRMPRADWPELADDVRFMGSDVAAERNQRMAQKSKRKG